MAFIKIRGVLVYLLLNIDPYFYGTFVITYKKDKKVVILKCMDAMYGTMVDSLIYYKKFVKTLKRTIFQINPYDPCVANRLVNDNQQTIYFHVDDCKLIQKDGMVND